MVKKLMQTKQLVQRTCKGYPKSQNEIQTIVVRSLYCSLDHAHSLFLLLLFFHLLSYPDYDQLMPVEMPECLILASI